MYAAVLVLVRVLSWAVWAFITCSCAPVVAAQGPAAGAGGLADAAVAAGGAQGPEAGAHGLAVAAAAAVGAPMVHEHAAPAGAAAEPYADAVAGEPATPEPDTTCDPCALVS